MDRLTRSDRRPPTPACLVVLSGLPGVGKTTIARLVSVRTGAIHVRVDSIEAALNESGLVAAVGGWDVAADAGYRIAYAVCRDQLVAGNSAIADSVNPVASTRSAWAEVASDTGAQLVQVEVRCRDRRRHRNRVEVRTPDVAGLSVPSWGDVQSRRYEPWTTPVLAVDTSGGPEPAVTDVIAAMARH